MEKSIELHIDTLAKSADALIHNISEEQLTQMVQLFGVAGFRNLRHSFSERDNTATLQFSDVSGIYEETIRDILKSHGSVKDV